jgi:hypothetical protein
VCQQGRSQIAANGSYSGTMAQYLTYDGKSKWQ